MFNNIGSKIKSFAKIVCWLGIIGAALSGLGIIITGSQMGGAEGTSAIVMGAITIIGGALLAWIGAFVTYGFGEIVENTRKIAEK